MSKYDKNDKRYECFDEENMKILDAFWHMFSCSESEFNKNFPKCHRLGGYVTRIHESTLVGEVKIGEFVHEMQSTQVNEELIKKFTQAGYLSADFEITERALCKEVVRLGYVSDDFFDDVESFVVHIFKYMHECDDVTFKNEFKGCQRTPETHSVSHIPDSFIFRNFDLGQWVVKSREMLSNQEPDSEEDY